MQNPLTLQVDTVSAELMMLQLLRQDFNRLTQEPKTWTLFSNDEKEEKKQFKKLLNAYKTILNYYDPEGSI